MTAIAACRTCGTEPLENARFCHGCGSPVDQADAPRAEYKQVTVLFADVVHSMVIAAVVGAERLREIMAGLVDRAAAVVKRYGGTVDKFTGDGIMAIFGAPIALEDHAVRACLAALEIQRGISDLAEEVRYRDGVELQVRIGLNSGQVIAGEVGSGAAGYTAVGEQVGMAQRMESVATPGAVMLSESTARLVEDRVVLGEPEMVHIKGADHAVSAHQLIAAALEPRRVPRRESPLVGRDPERKAISGLLGLSRRGAGALIAVAGPPGIGKTRLVRESVATARGRGFEAFATYCESHTREISFHVMSRLLCAVFGIGGLVPEEARSRVRRDIPDAGPENLVLLDDMLGIRDQDVPMPDVGPDAWRRRLVDLINTVSAARPAPAIYVIEDVHWIDSASESILVDLAAAVPRMRAAMLITYRPEYLGTLSHVIGAQTLDLAPLSDSHGSELIKELLGDDSSVAGLSMVVADRAAGIPFYAEEIVRDLAERGELEGAPGAYVCRREVGDIHVPPTLQATIGARIDRLTRTAKQTLNAAAVIGAGFDAELLECLLDTTDVAPLIDAELIDQVAFGPNGKYAFHHPLTQQVAYESQLKAGRSELHRRVAEVMQRTRGGSTGQDAAIIATQYEAAGDLRDAFDWYMRAANWYGARDIRAARASWQLAKRAVDRPPSDDPDVPAMRIAPRALLCGSAFQVGGTPGDTGFDELRELATAAGDKKSLAVGMAGHITTLTWNSRHREAADMASEFAMLIESIGDPAMAVGLLYAAAQAKWEAGEATDSLRLAQHIIDLAHGDPTMGDFVMVSPLAWAVAVKGGAGMFLGRPGWRGDIDEGIALARGFDPNTRVLAQLYKYAAATQNGAVLPDAEDVALAAESLELAERSGDNTAVTYALMNRATTLIHGPAGGRALGVEVLTQAREMLVYEQLTMTLRRMSDMELAREKARSGDFDGAIELARTIIVEQAETGEMIFRGPATTVLVEALLHRGSTADAHDARAAVDRLAAVPTDPGFVLHELPLLRMRALLARAHGDEVTYREFVDRYRKMATDLGFEGHIAWAEAMT